MTCWSCAPVSTCGVRHENMIAQANNPWLPSRRVVESCGHGDGCGVVVSKVDACQLRPSGAEGGDATTFRMGASKYASYTRGVPFSRPSTTRASCRTTRRLTTGRAIWTILKRGMATFRGQTHTRTALALWGRDDDEGGGGALLLEHQGVQLVRHQGAGVVGGVPPAEGPGHPQVVGGDGGDDTHVEDLVAVAPEVEAAGPPALGDLRGVDERPGDVEEAHGGEVPEGGGQLRHRHAVEEEAVAGGEEGGEAEDEEDGGARDAGTPAPRSAAPPPPTPPPRRGG